MLAKEGEGHLARAFNTAVDLIKPIYQDLWELNGIMTKAQSSSAIAASQFSTIVSIWRWAQHCLPNDAEPVRVQLRRNITAETRRWYKLSASEHVLDIQWTDPVIVGMAIDPLYCSLAWLQPIKDCLSADARSVGLQLSQVQTDMLERAKRACFDCFETLARADTEGADRLETAYGRGANRVLDELATGAHQTSNIDAVKAGQVDARESTSFYDMGDCDLNCEPVETDLFTHDAFTDRDRNARRTACIQQFNKYRSDLVAMRKNPQFAHLFNIDKASEAEKMTKRRVILQELIGQKHLSSDMLAFITRYFAVPKSSAESERAFSIAGLLDDRRRRALAPDRFGRILFLHDNLVDVARLSFPSQASLIDKRVGTTNSRVSPALAPRSLFQLKEIETRLRLQESVHRPPAPLPPPASPTTQSKGKGPRKRNVDEMESYAAGLSPSDTSAVEMEPECDDLLDAIDSEMEEDTTEAALDLAAEMSAMRGPSRPAGRLLDDFH